MPNMTMRPCGRFFCPSLIRMLWPEPAFNQAEISTMAGVTRNAARHQAQALGIRAQRPARFAAVYSIARFRSLWLDASKTRDEVAAAFGMRPSCCGQHAARLGLPKREAGRPTFKNWPPDFNAMWAFGLSPKRISLVVGCGRDAVVSEIRRRGLPDRKTVPVKEGRTITQFREMLLRDKMAISAAETWGAMLVSEMIDGDPRKHPAARRHAA